MNDFHPIITIDGPAGVGKSTLAKNLAKELKMVYLDTGAMFRCLALKLGEGAELLSNKELSLLCSKFQFSIASTAKDNVLLCNNTPIGDEIRSEYVGGLASKIATLAPVREALKNAQRAIGKNTPLIAEGRDMGSVVFPKARYKFFLDAQPAIRAFRRQKQLEEKGQIFTLKELTEQIKARDELDRNRAECPLKPAEDAIIIDTSGLSIEQVMAVILYRCSQNK